MVSGLVSTQIYASIALCKHLESCPDLNYYLQYYTNKQLGGLALLLIVMMFNGCLMKETALVDEAVCTVCVAHIRYLPNDPHRFWRRYRM